MIAGELKTKVGLDGKNGKELYIDFDEYIRQGEPSQREAAYAWA